MNKSELDEINFKEVIKSPIRWFGLIYFYFITIIVAIGLYYIYNLEVIQRNESNPLFVDSINIFRDVAAVKSSVSEGVDIKLLLNPTADMIKKGESLFKNNCVSCHGENGLGDGVAGAVLSPKPRNFHSPEGWKNGRKFSEIFKTLNEGIAGTGMPSYSYLQPEDRINIIFYVRSFKNDFPNVDQAEIDALDKQYNLAEGKTISSQIPVSLAKEKIIIDSAPMVERIYSIINNLNNSPDDNGTKLINRISKDKLKVVSFLNESNTWRVSLNDFVKTISSSSSMNGFNKNVISLSSDEWKELYQYMNKMFLKNG